MAELKSNLFTQGDAFTVQKLEDCATGQPNEAQSHFTIGQTGDHIKKVQEALKSVQETNPGLGIPNFSVNGVYDQRFADAIRIYKSKRDIRNFADKIDNVVGVKTIRSLDKENKSGPPKDNPTPLPPGKKPADFPKPLPNCVPDADCPTSKNFEVTLLAGVSGGEVVEVGKFFFSIRDTTNGLSAIYILRVGGVGFGSPLSIIGLGGPKAFQTGTAVRVTRFGPFGSMGGSTSVAGNPTNFSLLVLGFTPDGLLPRPTAPMTIDTGPIEVPGASIHAGQLKILSTCSGKPGATHRILGKNDVPT